MGKKDSKKQKVEVASKNKKAVPVKTAQESDDDDTSEEEVQVKPQKQKAEKTKPSKKPAKSSSDEESSEDEATAQPQVNSQKKGTAKKPAEESSSEDDSDEEMEVQPTKKPAPQKKTKEDSDEEDDDDDDDDDSSEEAAPAKKAPAGKQVGKKAKEQESSDEEDSDDEDEEEETVTVKENNKRKKEKGNGEPTPKKAKFEGVNGDSQPVTLFVGNLSANTSEEDISNFFSENSINIAAVRKLPNRNNAFVDLEDAGDLESALELNGSTLKKNSITVEKAKPRGQKEQNNRSFGSSDDKFNKGEDDKDSRTLFVKNLPEDATVDSLGAIFDTAADIRIPQRDGVHKGFGFIEFSDKDSMEAAMSEKQGADLNGNSLYLDYIGSKSSFKQRGGAGGRGGDRRGRGGFDGGDRRGSSGARGESKVLFVKNLSYDTDESSLKAAFDGAVSARIPTFPDSGKPKGFAFVDFRSAEAAADAYDSMNGQSIDGRQVTLDFAADKGSGGGGFGRGGGGGRGGGFGGRGRGGGFGGGFGGGRGRGGGRGGPRGGGGRGGGFNKARGGIVQSEGKKTKFEDSD